MALEQPYVVEHPPDPERVQEFTQVCEQQRSKLVDYCKARVGKTHPDLAEDLCQTVLLKGWAALPHYQDRGLPMAAWLFRIAHNVVVDHFRSQTQRPQPDSLDRPTREGPLLGQVVPLEAKAESEASICERLDVAAAFGKLTKRQQRAVLGRALGYAVPELAAAAAVVAGTQKRHSLEGRAALRRLTE